MKWKLLALALLWPGIALATPDVYGPFEVKGPLTADSFSMTPTPFGPQVQLFYEDADSGAEYVGIGSPSSVPASYVILLPTGKPAGNLLQCATPTTLTFSDGNSREAAVCSWVTSGGGTGLPDGTATNQILQWDGSVWQLQTFINGLIDDVSAPSTGIVRSAQYIADNGGAGTPQDADEVPVDASGFSGNLGSGDTDVQTALDTIDALSTGGTGSDWDEQANDPVSTGMTTGQKIVATGSGDLFHKSPTGFYIFPGTYTKDEGGTPPTPGAWPDDPAGSVYITVDTDGVSGDFATLYEALESLRAGTLSTPVVVTVAASTGVADVVAAEAYNIGPSAAFPLIIRPAAGQEHGGVWNDSIYRLVGTATRLFSFNDQYTTARGLQFKAEDITTDVVEFRNSRANNTLDSCIVVGGDKGVILNGTDAAHGGHTVINNIVYGTNNSGINVSNDALWAPELYIANNTVYNCNGANSVHNGGIRCTNTAGGLTLINNIAVDSLQQDYKECSAMSYNVSSDLTSTGAGAITGATAITAGFINVTAGSEDLHITAGSVAENVGSDESAKSTWDIDGHERLAPFDIGADQI